MPAPAPAPNSGRVPGGPERVGCGPRRSPGRSGGRPGAVPCPGCGRLGRGRWKMGLPRSGMPRAPVGVAARADAGGAWYTGRGPVCGTIRRRGGPVGCAALPGAPVAGWTPPWGGAGGARRPAGIPGPGTGGVAGVASTGKGATSASITWATSVAMVSDGAGPFASLGT